MKTVNLSQVPELYTAQRVGNDVIITLYDNIIELDGGEEPVFQGTIYQLKLPYRKGLLSIDSYEQMLVFAKKLTNPSSVREERQARDILL